MNKTIFNTWTMRIEVKFPPGSSLVSKLKFKVARELIPGLTAAKDGMSIMNSQG